MANAYTATGDLNTIPQYYDKLFLERLVVAPVMMRYALKKPVPLHSGKNVLFPRMDNSSTEVSAYKLTEGTVISTEKVGDAQISAVIEQFGNSKAIWDLTELVALSDLVEETVLEQADQAANIIDKRILQEAYGTSSVPTALGFSIEPVTSETASAFQTYASNAEHGATTAAIRKYVKKLQSRNVKPMDDGFYKYICNTDTASALQADSTWQAAYQNTDPENMRRGVIGTYVVLLEQQSNTHLCWVEDHSELLNLTVELRLSSSDQAHKIHSTQLTSSAHSVGR